MMHEQSSSTSAEEEGISWSPCGQDGRLICRLVDTTEEAASNRLGRLENKLGVIAQRKRVIILEMCIYGR